MIKRDGRHSVGDESIKARVLLILLSHSGHKIHNKAHGYSNTYAPALWRSKGYFRTDFSLCSWCVEQPEDSRKYLDDAIQPIMHQDPSFYRGRMCHIVCAYLYPLHYPFITQSVQKKIISHSLIPLSASAERGNNLMICSYFNFKNNLNPKKHADLTPLGAVN